MNQLNFTITIQAPKERIWESMLDPKHFRDWTTAFMPGSHYVGSWEEGASIFFLGPDGAGMASKIEVNRPHEEISIKHIGIVVDGLADTESEEAKKWTPSYERYFFEETDGATVLKVEQEVVEECEAMFQESWPQALARLKAICEETSSSPIVPYLYFGGNCEEAIHFYEEKLGAEVEMMMRFKDSPDPIPEEHQFPGFEEAIMHASLKVLGAPLMLSDGCEEEVSFQGFGLSVSVPTTQAADEAFNALAEDGTVAMPLAKTFWSPYFGMVKDKFGLDWMISVEESCPVDS